MIAKMKTLLFLRIANYGISFESCLFVMQNRIPIKLVYLKWRRWSTRAGERNHRTPNSSPVPPNAAAPFSQTNLMSQYNHSLNLMPLRNSSTTPFPIEHVQASTRQPKNTSKKAWPKFNSFLFLFRHFEKKKKRKLFFLILKSNFACFSSSIFEADQ